MNTQNQYSTYRRMGLETTAQKNSVLQHCFAALRFCQTARAALQVRDFPSKSTALHEAAEAISALRRALEADLSLQTVRRLDRNFAFLQDQLMLVKKYNDAEILDSVVTILTDMHQKWLAEFGLEAATASDLTPVWKPILKEDSWKRTGIVPVPCFSNA